MTMSALEKYDAFINALDNPPPAGAKLKALMRRKPLFVPPDHAIELGAAYERIDELSSVLTRARDYLIQFYPHSEAAHYCLDDIDQALEAHRVQA